MPHELSVRIADAANFSRRTWNRSSLHCMSSLSQEDLGAEREGSDVALAAARPDVSVDTKSIPPNSITLEKAAVPIGSLMIQAVTQAPMVAVPPEPAPFDFESREVDRDEVSPTQELLSPLAVPEAAGQIVEYRAVVDVPLMQSRTQLELQTEVVQSSQPAPAPASELRPIDAATQPEVTPRNGGPSTIPLRHGPSTTPDENRGAAVALLMRQLTEGAPPESRKVPIESTSIEAVVAGNMSSGPREVQLLVGPAHSRALHVAFWSAAALAALVISYWALHGGNKARPSAQASTISRTAPLSATGPSKSQADDIVVNAAVVAKVRSEPVDAPARTNKSGIEPGSVAQAESFADAFVKHAASANSNWAEVKKRIKAADTQSANRPNQTGVNASSDNPLGLLEQLEKTRKAKKQTSSQP